MQMKSFQMKQFYVLSIFILAMVASASGQSEKLKVGGNGVTVDVGRDYYDADPTVIQSELKILEFEGGFGTFEGGKNYVKAFGKKVFIEAIANSEVAMERALGLTKPETLEIFRESDHLNNLKKFNSDFYNFIEGMATEVGVPVEDIVIALNDGVFFAIGVHHVRDEVLEKLGFIKKGCTVAGFNNGLLGQNNDNPTSYSGNSVLVKSKDDKIMLLTMGSPLVMLMGMSEHIALVVNTVDAFFSGHSIRDGGLPDAAIAMNALLNFKSVDETIEKYRDTKLNVALAFTFADKEGGLGTIEFNAKQFVGNIILRPKENEHYIAHTNHPRLSAQYITDIWFNGDRGRADRMLARSFWRLQYAESFLATSSDNKVEEIQLLFKTHPVLFAGSDGLDFRTTVSVIWDIRNQIAYITPDRPDITDYKRVVWDK
jgi:hypothetical protein